ncbi:hypothetical protein [Polyangium mundeleinium]|uniref:Lipoprotein n=1 Tax=Polyangium mundeleinium TaxID=2995306 RepID=A0ABT5EQN8_9BACT|nr:hypothetical protein [Polyangium mundeleinium]MDC0744150.1 hypothetical protein [Polyangium mundeleinium]
MDARKIAGGWVTATLLATALVGCGSGSISVEPGAEVDEAAQTLPALTADWQVRHPVRTEIYSNDSYNLLNPYLQQYIRYKVREYGIDLVWSPNPVSPRPIRFRKYSGVVGPVKYDERIAISVEGGGYLRYQEREYGINLVWSNEPAYEWRLRGGTAGNNVRIGSSVILWNDVIHNSVVYCHREYGINLRWATDCENR